MASGWTLPCMQALILAGAVLKHKLAMMMRRRIAWLCRPFFLPCLLAALVSAIAFISNIFMLEETLPRIVAERAAARQNAGHRDDTAPLLAAEHGESASETSGKIQSHKMQTQRKKCKVPEGPCDRLQLLACCILFLLCIC